MLRRFCSPSSFHVCWQRSQNVSRCKTTDIDQILRGLRRQVDLRKDSATDTPDLGPHDDEKEVTLTDFEGKRLGSAMDEMHDDMAGPCSLGTRGLIERALGHRRGGPSLGHRRGESGEARGDGIYGEVERMVKHIGA